MTVTETPPEATGATSVAGGTRSAGEGGQARGQPPVAPAGLASVVGSGDHKAIGRLYIGASLLFLLVSGLAGQAVAIEKFEAGTLPEDTVFQTFTLHSVAGLFLFLAPFLLGVAMCVVPLQVGASAIAFPRAAAASFWSWLVAGGVLLAAYAINGGPGGGRDDGVDLWAVAFIAVLVALLLGALCVATTVLTLRAPGLTLARTPMFSWAMLVTSVLWLVSLPVLVATLALIYVDHRYGAVAFGRDGPVMYDRILWALRQPQIYAFAVPVLGFAADAVPVSARARPGRRGAAMGAIGAFGLLGFGAFVQPTVSPGSGRTPVAIVFALAAVVPVLVVLGGAATALRAGRPRLASPLLFSVAALLVLLVGALVGATAPIERFELGTDLYAGAHVHLVTLAATIGGLGGLWYWATKIVGRPLSEAAGRTAALVLLVGTFVLAFPDVLSVVVGDDREAERGIDALNLASAAGGVLVLLGLLLGLAGLLGGLRRRGDRVPDDPWDGHTLEWATPSPPPLGNFADLPAVSSATPLLDGRDPDGRTAGETGATDGRDVGGTEGTGEIGATGETGAAGETRAAATAKASGSVG